MIANHFQKYGDYPIDGKYSNVYVSFRMGKNRLYSHKRFLVLRNIRNLYYEVLQCPDYFVKRAARNSHLCQN